MNTDSETNGSPPLPPPEAADAALRERIRAEMEAGGLSQAAAAAQAGISDSALSQWLADKYGGDDAAVAGKLGRWLATRAERADLQRRIPAAPQWVETPAARSVLAALSYAQLAADIAVVHGAAGAGKTTAANWYAANRPNVWLATMSRGARSVGPCLRRVAAAVRAKPAGRSIAECEQALAERLRGTEGLLVIDEAQCLALPALDALRQIHDASGCGLALVGGEALWKRIAGDRASAELAQLFSRVGQRIGLEHPSESDADPLLQAWAGLGDSGREAARVIARQPGGLRAVRKVLGRAALMARGRQVERRHVAAAWKALGGAA